jgi:hypothetical protein
VNASQKEGIHHWLREHFPVKAVVAEKPKTTGRKSHTVAA